MLIPLTSGAYESRSVVANAQRSINLFAEINPPETTPEVPVTHYPTPGNTLLGTPPTAGAGRGLYVDTVGLLYAVIGANVYSVSQNWAFTLLGSITPNTTPVSLIDNETTIFLVDGSSNGYTIPVGGGAVAGFSDPSFFGSDHVDFLNTYFLFNQPDTPKFYTSLSNSTTFNPLYFADITGLPSNLMGVYALHGVVWMIGTRSTEIWFNSGDTNVLPFQRMPDMILHQGCIARYSIARMIGNDDSQLSIFWLGVNEDGATVVLRTQGYATQRISTHAIEEELRHYATLTDAVAGVYQQDGHSFYVLSFPTADVTWVYDATTGQWHQRDWLDANGAPHRYRPQVFTYAYGKNVALDWETGSLYELDLDNYTDNDQPIRRVRSFPHLVEGLNRVEYLRFVADMEAGADVTGSSDEEHPPLISLRWSDDRGATYGNAVTRSIGAQGDYGTSPLWMRLGTARDRVFEISWSVPARIALNGAYIEPVPLAS